MSARWSTGVVIGLPVLVLLALAGVVGGVLLQRLARYVDEFDRGLTLAGAVACYLVTFGVVGSVIGYWPYGSDYHKWTPKTGTVATVGNRFLGDGSGSTTQRFVVQFTDGRQFACDDTRCSLVKNGDHLTLSCKKEYQFTGTSGWACNFVRDEAKA